MFKQFVFFFLLLSSVLLRGQNITDVNIQANSLYADKTGNLYLLDDNKLIKTDEFGNILFTFDLTGNGKPSQVSVSDPLKTLLFYKDFGKIIILDKQLNQIGSYELSSLNINLPTAVGSTKNNGIWVFDGFNQSLRRITENGQLANSSLSMQNLLKETIEPNYVWDSDKYVFLNDPNKGIYVFDNYGSFYKQIPVQGLTDFQVYKDNLYYLEDGYFNIYNFYSSQQNTFNLNFIQGKPLCCKFYNDRLYILTEDKLRIVTL